MVSNFNNFIGFLRLIQVFDLSLRCRNSDNSKHAHIHYELNTFRLIQVFDLSLRCRNSGNS